MSPCGARACAEHQQHLSLWIEWRSHHRVESVRRSDGRTSKSHQLMERLLESPSIKQVSSTKRNIFVDCNGSCSDGHLLMHEYHLQHYSEACVASASAPCTLGLHLSEFASMRFFTSRDAPVWFGGSERTTNPHHVINTAL